MELLKIHETVGGDLFIKENTPKEGYSLPDGVYSPNKTASIINVYNPTKEKTFMQTVVKRYTNGEISHKFPITEDGWYKVEHFIIPLAGKKSSSELADGYYTDGEEVFHIAKHKLTVIDFTDEYLDIINNPENVLVTVKNTFVLFDLWQCYLNKVKRLLESECNQRCFKCDDDETKARDMLWMFLNNIQYLVQLGDLQRAQEFLEEISVCNSLCRNEPFTKNHNCNCA